jgi:hypothetical protein
VDSGDMSGLSLYFVLDLSGTGVCHCTATALSVSTVYVDSYNLLRGSQFGRHVTTAQKIQALHCDLDCCALYLCAGRLK